MYSPHLGQEQVDGQWKLCITAERNEASVLVGKLQFASWAILEPENLTVDRSEMDRNVSYFSGVDGACTVISALASGGCVAAVRSVLIEWIKQRNKPITIEILHPDGRSFKITGDLPEATRTALVTAAMQDNEALSRAHPAQAVSSGTQVVAEVSAHQESKETMTGKSFTASKGDLDAGGCRAGSAESK